MKTRNRSDTIASAPTERRFGGYAPAEEKAVRSHAVNDDPIMRRIMEAWQSALEFGRNVEDLVENELTEPECIRALYAHCMGEVSRIRGRDGTAQDFILSLQGMTGDSGHEKWKIGIIAGVFASAMINAGQRHSTRLRLGSLDFLISDLGWQSHKRIEVYGDVGDAFGEELYGGNLVCHGNAGAFVGNQMCAGKIEVEGSADFGIGNRMVGGEIIVREGLRLDLPGDETHSIANYMKGGRIVIEGGWTVPVRVGEGMRGGDIRIDGDGRFEIGDVKGGRIFYNGLLILER